MRSRVHARDGQRRHDNRAFYGARHGWRGEHRRARGARWSKIDLSIVRHLRVSPSARPPAPSTQSESSHLSLAFIKLGLSSNDEGRRHPDMSQPLIGTSSCLIGIIRMSAAQMNLIQFFPSHSFSPTINCSSPSTEVSLAKRARTKRRRQTMKRH